VIIKSQADLESAKNFAEAARILHTSPGGMELRRLEALQNLSGGTTKVIFDLAKPFDDTQTAAVAAAMGATRRRRAAPARRAQECGVFRRYRRDAGTTHHTDSPVPSCFQSRDGKEQRAPAGLQDQGAGLHFVSSFSTPGSARP